MLKKIGLLLFCFALTACHGNDLQTIDLSADEVTALQDITNMSVLGKKNAPVTLINAFAYECHYCREEFPLIEAFAKSHPDVRVIFKPFMVFGDKTNVWPQYAALAAGRQGQFLLMNHALMTTDKPLSMKTIHVFAREFNLKMNQFDQDLHSTAIDHQIQDNTVLMDQLGVNAVPVIMMMPTHGKKAYIQMGSTSEEDLAAMLHALEPTS